MGNYLNRRTFLLFFIGLAVFLITDAGGQAVAAEKPKIAVLISYDGAAPQNVLKGIETYLDQQEVAAELNFYPLQKNAAKATEAIQKIRQQGADMIISLGSLALNAACRENPDIPVVASMILDSKSLAKCDNASGVVLNFSLQTQFDWLKRFFPGAAGKPSLC